jgi:hypothetical protein
VIWPFLANLAGMSAKHKTEHVVMRMEPELRAAMEAAAEADRRPISNLVRCVLADWSLQTRRKRQTPNRLLMRGR